MLEEKQSDTETVWVLRIWLGIFYPTFKKIQNQIKNHYSIEPLVWNLGDVDYDLYDLFNGFH